MMSSVYELRSDCQFTAVPLLEGNCSKVSGSKQADILRKLALLLQTLILHDEFN
jgi:hypothetical protein